MTRFAIIGAGGLARQIAQHVGATMFFDDRTTPGERIGAGQVTGPLASIPEHHAAGRFDELLLGIGYGYMDVRERVFERIAPLAPFGRFVHPSAHVAPSARLGPGAFISPGCIIDIDATLQDNVFLYSGCIVSHDTVLGAHSFCAPGVRLAGHIRIGRRCFLGIGSTVSDGLRLADDVRTGAGAVVVRDLPQPGTYVGVPARRLP